MIKVNRKDLLHRLLTIAPGVSKRETIRQSGCVVIRRGRLYSLSQEISCSCKSPLPQEWDAPVPHDTLTDFLKLLDDEEVSLDLVVGKLTVKGKDDRVRITLEEKVVLPVDSVEKPKAWLPIDTRLPEAIDLVRRCTRVNHKRPDFHKECVRMTPQFLEASDNHRLIRFTIPSFVQAPVLMKGESVKSLNSMGVDNAAETDNWVHWFSPVGVRISIRKWVPEGYPDLSEFLAMRGRKIELPRNLPDAARKAEVIALSDLMVRVTNGEVRVSAVSGSGEYTGRCETKYIGPELNFLIDGKLLGETAKEHSLCEVTDHALRVQGEGFVFCTSLEVPKNGFQEQERSGEAGQGSSGDDDAEADEW